ncbi:MAG: acyl--CoA ligase family protein [Hydrogenibacillus schlegelii]|uniref:Acyl--CoA ligase family protein n=1 Tax=Hydrogenibacillus schlegelii TaxID=1484 RepID=A0A947G8T2_HYDSH|nr:acyl--CoA ligase family protein [Hydrogenibacillus schlegelii]
MLLTRKAEKTLQREGVPYRAPLTPAMFLERSAVAYRDVVAAVDGDRRLTYAELHERVHRLANGLERLGVGYGDRVAVLAPNTRMALEAHLALPLMGAVIVPINIRLKSAEIAYILDHSEASVLLIDAALYRDHAAMLAERRLRHVIFDGEAAVDGAPPWARHDYEGLLKAAPAEIRPVAVRDEWDLISLHYTSGTTGRPKGVMLHHRGAFLNALAEVIEAKMQSEDVYLWTLPMFHAAGWCFPWAVTAVGATHVLLPKVDPERIVALIEAEGVTHFSAAPTVLTMIAQHLERTGRAFPRPVNIITAAAPPSPALLRQMEGLGARITHVYGLTEVYGPFTVNAWRKAWETLPLEERARLKARQGVPYVGLGDVDVVDAEMRPVPADGETMGEVVMRGNGVMLGYYKDPAATEKAFAGGWFHTGDLGVMHPDGYIELRDRAKDIIISGGENISSIEVERVLLEHPAVLEVAVVGVPDEKWGEVPKAFVTLKPDRTATEAELIAFCRERLAHFKCPKTIEFGELPKTSTGKIQKYVLREREWQGRDRRIYGGGEGR